MKQIIYISRATKEFSNSELDALLKIARTRNSARGVTGMLVYSKGSFLQILEGHPDKVDEIYNKVHWDKRHRSVILLKELNIQKRSFPGWTMGFKRLSSKSFTPKAFFELSKESMSRAVSSRASEELIGFIRSFADSRVEA